MDSTGHCQSCGMPIETGDYCEHCVDDAGNLQTFDERLARMSQWMLRQGTVESREKAVRKALAHMATMPAWKDHPKVREAQR